VDRRASYTQPVLILPPGHGRELHQKRTLSGREKRILGGVLGTVGALVAAIVIALVAAAPTSKNGCIFLTIAAATGAGEIHQCGAQARQTCATVREAGAYPAQSAQEIAAECRKAGLPVGP
jgi:hypothetical protein